MVTCLRVNPAVEENSLTFNECRNKSRVGFLNGFPVYSGVGKPETERSPRLHAFPKQARRITKMHLKVPDREPRA